MPNHPGPAASVPSSRSVTGIPSRPAGTPSPHGTAAPAGDGEDRCRREGRRWAAGRRTAKRGSIDCPRTRCQETRALRVWRRPGRIKRRAGRRGRGGRARRPAETGSPCAIGRSRRQAQSGGRQCGAAVEGECQTSASPPSVADTVRGHAPLSSPCPDTEWIEDGRPRRRASSRPCRGTSSPSRPAGTRSSWSCRRTSVTVRPAQANWGMLPILVARGAAADRRVRRRARLCSPPGVMPRQRRGGARRVHRRARGRAGRWACAAAWALIWVRRNRMALAALGCRQPSPTSGCSSSGYGSIGRAVRRAGSPLRGRADRGRLTSPRRGRAGAPRARRRRAARAAAAPRRRGGDRAAERGTPPAWSTRVPRGHAGRRAPGERRPRQASSTPTPCVPSSHRRADPGGARRHRP